MKQIALVQPIFSRVFAYRTTACDPGAGESAPRQMAKGQELVLNHVPQAINALSCTWSDHQSSRSLFCQKLVRGRLCAFSQVGFPTISARSQHMNSDRRPSAGPSVGS